MKGWVYVITNKSGYPDLVKVGYSRQDPEYRVKSLSVGHPYDCMSEYEFLVNNPSQIEKQAHKSLALKREGGEWFRCSVEEAIAAIREVADKNIITEVNNYEKRFEDNVLKLNDANNAYEQKNYAIAFQIYSFLVEQNYVSLQNKLDIQCTLGIMYKNGLGVVQNYEESVNWYRKAAEQGHARAQYGLGFIYWAGSGVIKDYQEANEWFLKSAEQGYFLAQNRLGDSYEKGHGVVQSYDEAVNWYRKAAKQRYIPAQNSLKKCLIFIKLINTDNSSLDELITWADYYKFSKESFPRDKKLLLEKKF